MVNVSELISLPVINLYDLDYEGTIEKVCFDKNSLRPMCLLIYSESDEMLKALEYKNVFKICKDCVFIANSTKITLYENRELELSDLICPLNAMCYDLDGIKLGKITEICVENRVLHSIKIGEKTIPKSNVLKWSDKLILVGENKVNINRFRPKLKIKNDKNTQQIVSTMSLNPMRTITNYDFLLKRKVAKDIVNPNGEIIAKSGTIITFNLINKLKYYGKLKELTLNSK